eukprot:EG_transcript_3965
MAVWLNGGVPPPLAIQPDLVRDINRNMRSHEMERRIPVQLLASQYGADHVILGPYCVQLGMELGLSPRARSLASHLMNISFTCKAINNLQERGKFQLVVLVNVGLAAKMEDEGEQQPRVSELLDAADWAYTMTDFVRMERHVLQHLQWDLSDVTPVCFAEYYLAHSAIGSPEVDTEINAKTIQILDFSDMSGLHFALLPPSMVAAAALMMARDIVMEQRGLNPLGWGREMFELTEYTAGDLRQCYIDLWQAWQVAHPVPHAAQPVQQAAGLIPG